MLRRLLVPSIVLGLTLGTYAGVRSYGMTAIRERRRAYLALWADMTSGDLMPTSSSAATAAEKKLDLFCTDPKKPDWEMLLGLLAENRTQSTLIERQLAERVLLSVEHCSVVGDLAPIDTLVSDAAVDPSMRIRLLRLVLRVHPVDAGIYWGRVIERSKDPLLRYYVSDLISLESLVNAGPFLERATATEQDAKELKKLRSTIAELRDPSTCWLIAPLQSGHQLYCAYHCAGPVSTFSLPTSRRECPESVSAGTRRLAE